MAAMRGVLDDRELEAVDLLTDLGIARGVALTLLFLSRHGEATRADIEAGTGLRQPEVSTSTREMRDLRWVTKRDVKRHGKGRPLHTYTLAVTIADVVEETEVRHRAETERVRKAVTRIKALVSGRGRRRG